MSRHIISRILGSFAALFGASIVSFVLMRMLPGDPARLIVGSLASEEAMQAQIAKMGLNEPILTQYWRFIRDFFAGDWGFSYGAGEPVVEQFKARLPASLELGLYAFVFALVLAILLALLATYRQRRGIDATVRALSIFGMGMPPFWLALVALILFSEVLGILPGPGGRLSFGTAPPASVTGFFTIDALIAGEFGTFADALVHLILPAVALGMLPFGFLVRLLRANLLDITREPFIIVVRSKGIGQWTTYWRHALPNAFLPTLTASALIFAQLLGGSVLVEKVFDWPGMGALVVDSILRQDFSVVQAFIMLSALINITVNLIVDILYGVIDPRVRASGEAA